MSMSDPRVKKIYRRYEALVTSDLINASDEEIDAAITDPEPGMVIYNADLSIAKRKDIDGKWVQIITGGGGGGGGGTDTLYPITNGEIDTLLS